MEIIGKVTFLISFCLHLKMGQQQSNTPTSSQYDDLKKDHIKLSFEGGTVVVIWDNYDNEVTDLPTIRCDSSVNMSQSSLELVGQLVGGAVSNSVSRWCDNSDDNVHPYYTLVSAVATSHATEFAKPVVITCSVRDDAHRIAQAMQQMFKDETKTLYTNVVEETLAEVDLEATENTAAESSSDSDEAEEDQKLASSEGIESRALLQ